jgi:hypothetical protein
MSYKACSRRLPVGGPLKTPPEIVPQVDLTAFIGFTFLGLKQGHGVVALSLLTWLAVRTGKTLCFMIGKEWRQLAESTSR